MNRIARPSFCLPLLAPLMLAACAATDDGAGRSGTAAAPRETIDWRAGEAGILENHVQLTFSRDYYRAGEAYFSPDGSRIIFQAVAAPAAGEKPAEYYAMYVADVRRERGRIVGLGAVREISPPGSANTCGWFHPTEPSTVFFGTTLVPPTDSDSPGYNRGSGRYKWMFPAEMRIVRMDLDDPDGELEVIIGEGTAYAAEDGTSPDGRHMVYCSLATGEGDIYIRDLETGLETQVVAADGYDGGPFFSPDGRRICYRSDRANNDLLQVYVADLAFDDDGRVVGIEREYQLTRNEDVNWGPYWHPDGRRLVYATSTIGHHNYEVFVIDADSGELPGSPGPVRYGTGARRVTHASGADVLPTFSADGRTMLWTSQRGAGGRSQVWVADFVLPLD